MAAPRSTRTSKTLALGLPDYLDVPPRFGTLRNFNNPTYGPRIAKVHRVLTGKKPLPWQQYYYDVIGEVDPLTGFHVYREGHLTTMRQVGKTTNMRVVKAHRALDCTEPQTILFAAQDGIEAKNKWLEHAQLIKRSPLGIRLSDPEQPTTSNGKEELQWDTLSTERPISSRPSSGHGETLDLGIVTEAFALVDARYEDTMLFAMNARPDAQLLVESTEGTAESLYWNENVDENRARIEEDPRRQGRIAFFDWSFGPDDDPSLPETWRRRIPSLGHTMRVEEVQYAFDRATTPVKMRQFLRGFGNIRDTGAVAGTMFEPDVWESGARPDSAVIGDFTFSLEISPDRAWTTVSFSGTSTVRGMHVGIARRDRGTHWFLEYLGRKMPEFKASTIYVAAGSPAALAQDDLERIGLTVVVLNRAEIAASCAGFFDDVVAGDISYTPGQEALDTAVGGAKWTSGDVRTFSRTSSVVDISPLYGVAIARYGSQITARTEAYDPLRNIF
jgi:hypothetical protein